MRRTGRGKPGSLQVCASNGRGFSQIRLIPRKLKKGSKSREAMAGSQEIEKTVAQRARERARVSRWDLDIAVFLFAVLIIILILLFQGIGLEIVAPVAVFGLAMVWLAGWRRGRQLYPGFYNEELSKLRHALEETEEERIDEKVQRALRERER